ncbi:MAG TPA: sulfite exporter TauE/SafE family protein [Chloroflexi bacterium]|nr:sulfite exporter TauE/SafE family protein [Chloroflexota bacterium]
MSPQLIVSLVIFLAVFTQSMAGFGSALVAMALLPAVIGLQVATPLVALMMTTIEIFLLIRYRESINFRAVLPLIASAFVGIPLGVVFLTRLDETAMLALLGLVIAGYAVYALLKEFNERICLPEMAHPAWAYFIGLIAGMLGGAYNTFGPPVIIYGNCRRWGTTVFKSNLQAFFVVTSLAATLGHAWNGGLTPEVWHYYLWSIPAMAVGIVSGISLDRFIQPEAFRRIVLVLLVIMGVRLGLA